MTKVKIEPSAEDAVEEKESWDVLVTRINQIASPLASRKLTKKVYKVIKKARKEKQIRKGVREVQRFVRKGERGIVLLAGDVFPIDVISHMPVVLEESDIPYCYVPSKKDLAAACGSFKPTCMVLVKPHADYQALYDECFGLLRSLPQPITAVVSSK